MSEGNTGTKIVPLYAGPQETETTEDRFSKVMSKLGSIGTGGTFFFLGMFMASGAVIRFTDFEMVALTLAAWFTPGAASAFGAVSTAATVYGWSLILRKKSKLNKKDEAKGEAQNQLANLMEFIGGFLSQGGAVASTVAAGAAITVTSVTYLPEENIFGIEKPPVSIQRLKLSQLFESTEAVAAIHEQERLEELAAADETDLHEEETAQEEIELAHEADTNEEIETAEAAQEEEELLVIDMTGGSVRIIHNLRVYTDPAAIETLIENITAGRAAPVPAVIAVNVPRPAPDPASRSVPLTPPGALSVVDESAVEPAAPVIYIAESELDDTSATVVAYVPAAITMPPIIAAPDIAAVEPQADEAHKPPLPQNAEQSKPRGMIVSVRPEFIVVMGEMSTAGVIAEAGMVSDNGLFLTADVGGGGNYYGGGVNVGYAFVPFGDAKSVVGLSGGFHNATVVHNFKAEDGTLLHQEQGNKIGAAGVFVKLLPFRTGNLDITNRVLLGRSSMPRFHEGSGDFHREEGLSAAYSIGVGYSIMKRGE